MRAAIAAFLTGLCLCLPAKAQEARETAHYAIITGDTPLLDEALAGQTVFSKATQRDLLTLAARQGAADMVRHLVEAGFDPDLTDAEGYSVIMRTLEAGQVEMAVLLRELGASLEGVTEDGYTVRLLAENAGLEDFGPVYPARLPNVSQDDLDQMLLLAAEAGNLANVSFALDYGADPAARAGNGWNALMLAALGAKRAVVETLLRRAPPEADMFLTVGDGIDPVMAALIGEGAGQDAAAGAVIDVLRDAWPEQVQDRLVLYRKTAHTIGYSDRFIEAHLSAPAVPPPDVMLPGNLSSGRQGWREMQAWLVQAGVDDLMIDGLPGKQTVEALLRAIYAAEETLHARCVEAAENALQGRGAVITEGAGALVLTEWSSGGRPTYRLAFPVQDGWLNFGAICEYGPYQLRYASVETALHVLKVRLPMGTLTMEIRADGAEIVLVSASPPRNSTYYRRVPHEVLRVPESLKSAVRNVHAEAMGADE